MAARAHDSQPTPRSRRAAEPPPAEDPARPRNEVHLVGRVSAEPEERELPSGDLLVVWRLVVDRAPPRRAVPAGVRTASIDTIECVAWGAGPRRTARALRPGDVVDVSGSLRRRFFRAGGGAGSRTEVEVEVVRRLVRAPAP